VTAGRSPRGEPRVAFATYRDAPELSPDDRLAAEALRRRGVDVRPAVWNDQGVDWEDLALVVIRSTWDYHLARARYEAWVRRFAARPGVLWNPPPAVLGTLDKRYLIELARRGVRVVPTAYVAAADARTLAAVIDGEGWDEVVIKPSVSASARGTWRSSLARAAADQERFAAQRAAQDLLIQPFCPEVAARGEWSLIFLGGEYSHAVLKRPADGDFRVQRHFGGSPAAAVPGARLIDDAAAVLGAVGGPLLYARVDGIERAGRFVLMEAEINEPSLFLSFSDDAPRRFADAIAALIRSGGR
jgi:hypothetical protein